MQNFARVLFLLCGLFLVFYRFAFAHSCTIWTNEYLNRFKTCSELCTTFTRLSSVCPMRCFLHNQNFAIYSHQKEKFSQIFQFYMPWATMPAMCRKYERPRPPRFLDLVYKFKMRLFFRTENKIHSEYCIFLCIHWMKSFVFCWLTLHGFFSLNIGNQCLVATFIQCLYYKHRNNTWTIFTVFSFFVVFFFSLQLSLDAPLSVPCDNCK